MDAYYINLDKAQQRRQSIEAQIEIANLNFHLKRFPAIDGKIVNLPLPLGLTTGQWGCWLSHLCVQQLSLDTQEHLLVIEDDSYFDESLNLILNIDINSNWDIIYLDATIVEIEDYLFLSRIIKNIRIDDINYYCQKIPSNLTCYGTIGYIINKESKHKIFNLLFNQANKGLPIDNILCNGIHTNQLQAYFLLPTLLTPSINSFDNNSVSGEHPLSKDWIKFRSVISRHNKDFDLQIVLKEVINNRLDFSAFKQFTPFR